MGFLDKLFGKTETTEQIKEELNIPVQKTNTINLRKEMVGICLAKKDIVTKARVALVLDDSGSTASLYDDGTVQDVIERLLPVAIKLDENSELDVWLFDSRFKRLPSISENDFHGYVKNVIMKHATWGGTNYSGVMNDVVKKYVVEEPSDVPTFVIFITDGECFDTNEARQAIRNASNHNIFWQFIGIGDERFRFLGELDTMEGRVVDNANFFKLQNVNHVSDSQLYDMLLNEFPSWEKEAKKTGILK